MISHAAPATERLSALLISASDPATASSCLPHATDATAATEIRERAEGLRTRLYNSPPTLGVSMLALVMLWLLALGSLPAIAAITNR